MSLVTRYGTPNRLTFLNIREAICNLLFGTTQAVAFDS